MMEDTMIPPPFDLEGLSRGGCSVPFCASRFFVQAQ